MSSSSVSQVIVLIARSHDGQSVFLDHNGGLPHEEKRSGEHPVETADRLAQRHNISEAHIFTKLKPKSTAHLPHTIFFLTDCQADSPPQANWVDKSALTFDNQRVEFEHEI